jgi:hypothetical protein
MLTYQNNDKKIIIIFSNMRYSMYCYVVKFQLKTLPMNGEIRNTNYIMG